MSLAISNMVRDAIGGEPGLVCISVTDLHATYLIEFQGLGPSLHMIELRGSVSLFRGDAKEVASQLAPILAIQRRRRTAAILLGLPGMGATGRWRVGHMALDALLLEYAPAVVDTLRRSPRGTQSTSLGALDQVAGDGIVTIDDGTKRDPRPRVYVLTKTHFGHFDGSDLMLQAELPETTLAACIGRRVRDVVDVTGLNPVFDRLAAREIVDARMNGDRVVLTTWPDLVNVPPDDAALRHIATEC